MTRTVETATVSNTLFQYSLTLPKKEVRFRVEISDLQLKKNENSCSSPHAMVQSQILTKLLIIEIL